MTILILHFPPLHDTPTTDMLPALWIIYTSGLILEVNRLGTGRNSPGAKAGFWSRTGNPIDFTRPLYSRSFILVQAFL